jgi:hypothetical protein
VLTAVNIDSSGRAAPVDPFVPTISHIHIFGLSGSYIVTATVNANNFAVGNLVVFSGMGTADFLNGITGTVTSASPLIIAMNASLVIPAWALPTPYDAADTGSILYAIDASGAVLAPNPDGVTLTSGIQGQSVTVTSYYGEQYFLSPVTATDQIVVGGLLYVGLDGRLTQDFTSITTGTAGGVFGAGPFGIGPFSSSLAVGWIICIGRVVAYDPLTQTMTFIYEPHVPTRFSSSI